MQHKKIKTAIIILAVLLALSLAALGGVFLHNRLTNGGENTVTVPDNLITPEEEPAAGDPGKTQTPGTSSGTAAEPAAGTATRKAATIELYSRQPEENTAFQVGNMFPGDRETKYFRVRVSFRDQVTVHYRATVRPGYEKLSEVLKVRVSLLTTGETLYDGLMSEMPESVTHRLSSQKSTTEELYYDITAYLDTSVGNDYQNLDLVADFSWWVEETGNLAPRTGDTATILLWTAAAAATGGVLILLLVSHRRKEEKMAETKTAKKLTGGIITIVVLAVCLCITTFALVYETVSVENNLFHTGEVKINLNDGKPVIQEHEFLFEPGMTVKKDFFIENDSTWDVYYRLYLNDVSGGLADVLTVTIQDGDKVLYTGTANELTQQNIAAADDTLKIGQRRNLTAVFHYPETAGNNTQNLDLTFTLCAEATQTKNNPNKQFD